MKKHPLPSHGGSYTRDPSGKLAKNQPQSKPVDAAKAKPNTPKAARKEA